MTALKYPFHPVDESYVSLGRLVKRQKPDDIPKNFSKDIRVLLSHLLDKDPKKRPNIN